MSRYTETAALATHGIDADLGLDYVRHVQHVLAVCLTCASIVTAPDAMTWATLRETVDFSRCCSGGKVVTY